MKIANGLCTSKMREEKSLLDLIPDRDPHLRATWTKLNVILIVAVCLLLLALGVVFFLFPRSVDVSYGGIKSVEVSFDHEQRRVLLNITSTLDITNNNYHHVNVTYIKATVICAEYVIGQIRMNSSVHISPRSQSQIDYTVPSTIGNDLSYMYEYCTLSTIKIHNIGVMMETVVTTSYFGHTELHYQDPYSFVDCGANTTLRDNTNYT